MTNTLTRKTPRQFGEEVERLQAEGRWNPETYLRLVTEAVEAYGPDSGVHDAIAHAADPEWRDQVIFVKE